MSSRLTKVTPEVALLVKKAEISEGWSVQERQRRFDIFPPGMETPVQIGKDADPGDVRRAQSALSRYGLDKAKAQQPPAPPKVTEQVSANKIPEDPYPGITIFEKAKKVWKDAKDYAVANGKPLLDVAGSDYFLIDDKPLSFFISRRWARIRHYDGPGGSREIYDFLRSTGHCVRERQEDETSLWVVRTEWSDAGTEVIIRSPRKAVSDYERERARKENKISAKEAGEDREPGPVTVTRRDPEPEAGGTPGASEPTPGPAPTPASTPTPEDARMLAEARARQESLTCPECKAQKKKFVGENPQGLAAHRRAKHGVQGSTVKADAVGRIDPEGPLGEVGMAMEMLRESLLATVARAIDPAPYEQQISSLEAEMADLRAEVAYQRADAQVQRERAERVEQTLGCIRLAFDTLPVNKAVAETLDLIPPVTE